MLFTLLFWLVGLVLSLALVVYACSYIWFTWIRHLVDDDIYNPFDDSLYVYHICEDMVDRENVRKQVKKLGGHVCMMVDINMRLENPIIPTIQRFRTVDWKSAFLTKWANKNETAFEELKTGSGKQWQIKCRDQRNSWIFRTVFAAKKLKQWASGLKPKWTYSEKGYGPFPPTKKFSEEVFSQLPLDTPKYAKDPMVMLNHGEYEWRPATKYQSYFHMFMCQDYHAGPLYWLATIDQPFSYIIVNMYDGRKPTYDYFRSIEFAESTADKDQLGIHYFASFREMDKNFEPVASKNNLHGQFDTVTGYEKTDAKKMKA